MRINKIKPASMMALAMMMNPDLGYRLGGEKRYFSTPNPPTDPKVVEELKSKAAAKRQRRNAKRTAEFERRG